MIFKRKAPVEPELNGPIRNLIQRLNQTPGSAHRIVTFIAARHREGTTTIARHYAEQLSAETNQRVLLIDAGPLAAPRFIEAETGIVDAVISQRLPSKAIQSIGDSVSVGRWIGNDENRSLAGRVIHNASFWEGLMTTYDAVVIDAPSLQSSFDGVVLAAKSDITVLVVEAESTPEAVVCNLRDTLTGAGAHIAGMVMNKRRFYIPNRAYRRL